MKTTISEIIYSILLEKYLESGDAKDEIIDAFKEAGVEID